MKILITGMNKLQCTEDFYLRQQLKVIPSHYSLIRCLRDMGHVVHQRELSYDESTEDYDKVIMFLASPRQLVATTFYTGLSTIAKTPWNKLIFAFDDWQIDGIIKGVKDCNTETKIFDKFILNVNKSSEDELQKYKKDFFNAIDIIATKPVPILISAFSGGDISLLGNLDKNLIYTYNPNPYHHNRRPGNRWDIPVQEMSFMESINIPSEETDRIPHEFKSLKFNFASLVQSKTRKWLKKQNIKEWEIEFFGSKKDGQRRLTESEMVKVFNEQWGCLMPGYDHAGSGWWRARPLQVADAESILIGDPKEMMIYYQNEELASIKASDLENMTISELHQIAMAQKNAIYNNHPLDKNIQKNEIERILKA